MGNKNESCSCGRQEPKHNECYEQLPTRVKECKPIIHPTRHRVVEQTEVIVIPEVHPSHTTFVNNRVLRHVHSYPQSESVEEHTENENVVENGNRNNGGNGRRRGGWSWI